MRGIILAGGTGSRLGVLTANGVNKHVLDVGGRPMIIYPLCTLLASGVTDITVVSTPSGVGQIELILKSGKGNGCRIEYRVQDNPGGIAHALLCAKRDSGETIAVILGDNVFAAPPMISPAEKWAHCYLKKIDDVSELRQFGVPVFAGEKIAALEEKPQNPKSNYAVTGLYVFGHGVWDELAKAKPGARGELEITDLLDWYARAGLLSHTFVEGFWGDAGTHEGIAECSAAVRAFKGES